MTQTEVNELGQIVGATVDGWQAVQKPDGRVLTGESCRLEKLDIASHGSDLYQAYGQDKDGRNWTYLPYGPFENEDDFLNWLSPYEKSDDPFFYSVIDLKTEKAVGVATYLRITPDMGSIEVGHIHFSPSLQRTPMSTEAMYLMMKHAFEDLGYRRYEWKCNNLNEASKKAALRLGFTFEGVFRQMLVIKGRNRDTAWFSILDHEWPTAKTGFEKWLDPDNFDADGKQKSFLATKES